MIPENGSRLTMTSQLHCLVQKHGLNNVADSLLRLCFEQAHLTNNNVFEESIKHLEKLIESSSKIQDWN